MPKFRVEWRRGKKTSRWDFDKSEDAKKLCMLLRQQHRKAVAFKMKKVEC